VTPAAFIVSEDVRDKLASNTTSRDPLKYLPFWADLAELMISDLSSRYRHTRLFWQLRRAVIENQLWVKNDKHTWKPNSDPLFEAEIEGLFIQDFDPEK
jgi:hypothetical protein